MAERTIRPESPFGPALTTGRSGVLGVVPGVAVTKRAGLAILSLIARRGAVTSLTQDLLKGHGFTLPDGPHFVAGPALSAIGIGPGRWLLVGETLEPDGLYRQVAAEMDSLAAVADLSDAFAVLRLAGPAARAVLAKGLPIDLHPRCFGPGDAAGSVAGLVPLQLWQLDDYPTYEIAVPRSMAGSFAAWLTVSAAEFGLLVEP